MTFGECKMIALQKMSALSVSYLTESRDTRPYLDIMTAPANEGILMIAAVCPVVRSVEIVQTGGTQQGQRRYELAGLAPDFVRLRDDGVYTQRGGVSARCADWQLEAGKVLLLPDREGLWRIYYEARPALFNEQSTDADPVDLPEQAHRHAARAHHAPRVGLDLAREQLQQRGLSVAVAADDADARTLVDAARDILEHRFGREIDADLLASQQKRHEAALQITEPLRAAETNKRSRL